MSSLWQDLVVSSAAGQCGPQARNGVADEGRLPKSSTQTTNHFGMQMATTPAATVRGRYTTMRNGEMVEGEAQWPHTPFKLSNTSTGRMWLCCAHPTHDGHA